MTCDCGNRACPYHSNAVREHRPCVCCQDSQRSARVDTWERERDCGDAEEYGLDGHRNRDKP